LHGSVWEWVLDFNSVTIDSDSRESGQSAKFCGAGGFNSSSPRDYAAFMRQAFRSGLTAASTTRNLGFRCARSAD
ncbi:MAG: SUMF1/EgtB/PvdO family nonheme iron enzyme, partial [Leptospirales bacterium]